MAHVVQTVLFWLLQKKVKSGDTQISLDARWGVNSRLVKNYDVLQNANTYMETAYSALYNGYLYNSGYTAEQAYQLANADLFPKLGYQVYTIPDDISYGRTAS